MTQPSRRSASPCRQWQTAMTVSRVTASSRMHPSQGRRQRRRNLGLDAYSSQRLMRTTPAPVDLALLTVWVLLLIRGRAWSDLK
jgi:hypothetical protein